MEQPWRCDPFVAKYFPASAARLDPFRNAQVRNLSPRGAHVKKNTGAVVLLRKRSGAAFSRRVDSPRPKPPAPAWVIKREGSGPRLALPVSIPPQVGPLRQPASCVTPALAVGAWLQATPTVPLGSAVIVTMTLTRYASALPPQSIGRHVAHAYSLPDDTPPSVWHDGPAPGKWAAQDFLSLFS